MVISREDPRCILYHKKTRDGRQAWTAPRG